MKYNEPILLSTGKKLTKEKLIKTYYVISPKEIIYDSIILNSKREVKELIIGLRKLIK